MVKFYGVVFLGLPREEAWRRPRRRPCRARRAWSGWRSGAWCWACSRCSWSARSIRSRTMLVGATLQESLRSRAGCSSPRSQPERASYSPLIFLLVIVGVVLVTFLLVRRFYHGRMRRAPPWDCGFPARRRACRTAPRGSASRSSRSSSRSSSIERHHPSPFDERPHYSSQARGPPLVLVVPADRQAGRAAVGAGRRAASRPHSAVSGLQLRHAAVCCCLLVR